MDIGSLSIFISVMQRRNFAAVAKTFGVSASSVSRSISALERELGVRLFQRTTRSVSPTDAAIRYLESVEPLVRELKQVNEEVANRGDKPQGTLRLSSPISFAETILSEMLVRFSEEYPEIDIELLASNAAHDLRAERIDVAIRYGQLRDYSLVASRLCPLEEVVCASPAYLAKHGTPASPHDLGNHSSLLFMLPNYPLSWHFRKAGESEIVVPLQPQLRSSSAQSLMRCAIEGMGITVLSRLSVQSSLQEGSLAALFTDYEVAAKQFDSSVWVVYPSKEHLPLRARVFIDFLKSHIER